MLEGFTISKVGGYVFVAHRRPAPADAGRKHRIGGMLKIRFMKHGDDITILRGNVMASKQEVLELLRRMA